MAKDKSAIIKSAGKAAKYTARTLIKAIMPSTISTAESVVTTASDLGAAGKRAAIGVRDKIGSLSASAGSSNPMRILEAAMSDIENGTFSIDGLSSNNFDMYDDLDFSSNDIDEESDIDDTSSSSPDSAELGKAIIYGNSATIDAIKKMTEALGGSHLKGARSTNLQLQNISALSIGTMSAGFAGVNSRLDVMNKNIAGLLQFHNSSTSVIHQQTQQFYDQIASSLKTIEEGLKPVERSPGRKYDASQSYMDGSFDMSMYVEQVKKNFNDSLIGSLGSMAGTMVGSMGGSLMETIPELVLSFMFSGPGKKKGLAKLDENIQKYIKQALYKIGDKAFTSDNPLAQMIGEIFGAKRPTLSAANMGDFHKDAMPWNGISQKYLTEVIPGYLSRIEAGINKSAERLYDAETGKFRSKESVAKQYARETDTLVQNSLYTAIDRLNNALERNGVSGDQKTNIQQNVSNLVHERINDSGQTSSSYKKKISSELSTVMDKEDFKDIIMQLEEGIAASVTELMSRNEKIQSGDYSSSAYRHLFNEEGKELHSEKDRVGSNSNHFKGNAVNFTSSSSEYASEDFIRTTASVFSKPGENFKLNPDFLRAYNSALSSGGDYKELSSLIKREVLNQRKRAGALSVKEKIRMKLSPILGASNAIEKGANAVDSMLFDATMGIKYDPTGKAGEKDKSVGAASSRKSNTEAKSAPVTSAIGKGAGTFTDRLTRKVGSMTHDRAMKLTKKDQARNVTDIEGALDEQKDSAKFAEQNGDPSAAQEAYTNTATTSVLAGFSGFSNVMGGLFGKDGFFSKFFNGDKIKIKLKELFNENDGVFSGLTKAFLDGVDSIKHVFTGKEYTDRKGKKHAADENSVFAHLQKTYQFLFKNTMSYIFGDEYEQNGSYQKFFQWMDLDKRKKDKEEKKKKEAASNAKTTTKKTNQLALPGSTNSALLMLPEHTEARTDDHSDETYSTSDDVSRAKLPGDVSLSKEEAVIQKDAVKTNEKLQDDLAGAVAESTALVKSSAHSLSTILVGDDAGDDKKVKSSFFKKFKDNLPKILTAGLLGAGATLLTGGSLGLIGGLFLPSGPVGGALMGIGVSLLSKSEGFKKFLFGEYDESQNKKVGGLLSQRSQDAMKKAMPMMIGGAVLGGIKGLIFGNHTPGPFGFMVDMLTPGGAIGGALMGMAGSLIMNSSTFKKILFGEKDEDGKRSGGFLARGMNLASKALGKSKHFIKGGIKGLGIGALTGAVLSHAGILGSAVSMGGPIGMGIVGMGLGIASQTTRFKELLFGTEETDENGNSTGKKLENGLIHKVRNMLVVNIFDPVKQTVHDEMVDFALWAKEKIMFPFRLAFGPLLDALGGLKDDIGDYVKSKFDILTDGIGSLLKATFKKIFSPITKLVGNLASFGVKTVSNVTKLALLPVTATLSTLRMFTAPGRAKANREFYTSYAKGRYTDLKNQWSSEEEETGKVKSIFGKAKDIYKAATDEAGFKEGKKQYYNAQTDSGKNHLGWRNVGDEYEQLQLDKAKAKEERKKWKSVDKIRSEIANRDKTKSVYWKDKETDDIRTRLKKAGMDTGIDTERDIKQLIFDKDDWKDKFEKKKGTGLEAGMPDGTTPVYMLESPEQKATRKKTEEYQQTVADHLKNIGDIMYDLGLKDVEKKRKKKEDDRFDSRKKKTIHNIKKRGIDPASLGYEDNPDVLKVPMHEFENYRNSPEFATGDFKGWYKKNNHRWNPDVIKKEGAPPPPKSTASNNTAGIPVDSSKKERVYSPLFKNTGFGEITTAENGILSPAMIEKVYRRTWEKGSEATPEEFMKTYIGADYKKRIARAKAGEPEPTKEKPSEAGGVVGGGVVPDVDIPDVTAPVSSIFGRIKDKFKKKGVTSGVDEGDSFTESLLKSNQQVIDRLDSLNEATYGGAYNRKARSKTVGKPMGAKAVNAAHVSESEIGTSTGKTVGSIFSGIFGKFKKAKKKEKDSSEESEEDKAARALGDKDPGTAIVPYMGPPQEEDDKKKPEKKESFFSKMFSTGKGLVGGLIGKVFGVVGGILGSVGNFLSDQSVWVKLGLGALAVGVLQDKIGPLVSPIFDWVGDTLFGPRNDNGKRAGGGLIDKAKIVVFGGVDEYGNDVTGWLEKATKYVFGGTDENGQPIEGAFIRGVDTLSKFLIENGSWLIETVTKTIIPLVPALASGIITVSVEAFKVVVGNLWSWITGEKSKEDRQFTDSEGNKQEIKTDFQEKLPGYALKGAAGAIFGNPNSAVGKAERAVLGKVVGAGGNIVGRIAGIPGSFLSKHASRDMGRMVGGAAESAAHGLYDATHAIGGALTGRTAREKAAAAAAKEVASTATEATATNAVKSATKVKVYKAGSRVTTKTLNQGGAATIESAAKRTTGKVVSEAAEAIIDKGGDVAVKEMAEKGAKSTLKGVLKSAVDGLMALANNPAIIKICKPFAALDNAAAKIAKTLGDMVLSVGTKAIDKVMGKTAIQIAERAATKIGTETAKGAAGAASAGLITLGFAIFDAATGAFEADRLFGVNSSEVDGLMRTISSIMKCICGLPIVVYVDIAAEIVAGILGYDLKKNMATSLYKLLCFGDEQKKEELDRAQVALEIEWKNWQKDTGNEGTSFQAYKDLTNKTVVGGFMNTVTGKREDYTKYGATAEQIAEAGFSTNGYEAPKQSGGAKFAQGVSDTVKKTGEAISTGFTASIDFVKDVGPFIGQIIKGAVLSGLGSENTNKVYIDPEDPMIGFKTSLFKIVNILCEPITLVIRTGKAIFDSVKKVGNDAIAIGKNYIDTTAEGFVMAAQGGLSTVFGSSYWTPKETGGTMAPFSKATFYISRVLSAPLNLLIGAGATIFQGIKTIADEAIAVASGFIDTTAEGFSMAAQGGLSTVFSSDYWTPPEALGPMSVFGSIAFYTSRVVSSPLNLVIGVGSTILNGVKTLVNSVVSTFGVMKDISNEGTELVKSQGIEAIFSSKYWTPTDNPDNPMDAFGKISFYTTRVVTTPINMVIGIGKAIVDKFKDLVGDIGAIPTDLKNNLTDTDVWSQTYWKYTKNESNSFDWFTQVLFYINRVITFIPDALTSAFDNIGDGIMKLIDKIKLGSKKIDDASIEASNNTNNELVIDTDPSMGSGDGVLSQKDPRWSKFKIGKTRNGIETTMANGGCGPTALSEVARSIGGENKDPLAVAQNAKARGYLVDGGSSSRLFTQGASDMGLRSTSVGKDDLLTQLRTGKPMIISGKGNGDPKQSPFTSAGHIVTATGVDKNGNILVKDPKYGKTLAYSPDAIKNGMTGGWSFSKGYGDADEAVNPGDKDPFSSVLGIFGKLGSVAKGAMSSMMSGEKYERVLDDNGEYLVKPTSIMDNIKNGIGNTFDGSGTKPSTTTSGSTSTSSSGGKKFTGTGKQFIELVAPLAIKQYHKHKILPSVIIAQAIWESGWGKSSIGNNLFGVKAYSNWHGATQTVETTEWSEARGYYKTVATFKDYPTYEASIEDHSKTLLLSHYRGIQTAKNYKDALYIIQKGGYSTSPEYATKLIQCIEQNKLYIYDAQAKQGSIGLGDPTDSTNAALMGDEKTMEAVNPGDKDPFSQIIGTFGKLGSVAKGAMSSMISGEKYERLLDDKGEYIVKPKSIVDKITDGFNGIFEKAPSNPTNPTENAAGVSVSGGTGANDWFTKTFGSGTYVSSKFGEMRDLNDDGYAEDKHTGIDFTGGGILSKPIYTPVGGTVRRVVASNKGYGNYVSIQDGMGYYHLFGHMKNKSHLKEGDMVKKGDLVGYVGSSGNSTGPHLHYEVRNSQQVMINPASYPYKDTANGYGDGVPQDIQQLILTGSSDRTRDASITTSSQTTKSMNITKSAMKNDSVNGVGAGDADAKIADRDNISVSVHTEKVEDRLDILIDILSKWKEVDEGRESKAAIAYGQTTNLVNANGGGKATPIPVPQKNEPRYNQSDLVTLHRQIAAGRRGR